MVSKILDDYEVISILGSDVNSCYYKVKNKRTSDMYAWKAISIEKYNEDDDLNKLIARIEESKNVVQTNLLQIYDYIIYDNKVLYLIVEYCSNGNLYELILRCRTNNEYIEEAYVKYIIYELATIIKSCSIKSSLDCKNVFMDNEHNIKLMMFEKNHNTTDGILDICNVLKQLVSLDITKEQVPFKVPNCYTKSFATMINDFVNTKTSLTLDAILCHPLLLAKGALKDPIKKVVCHKSEAELHNENDENHKLEIRLRTFYKKESQLRNYEDNLRQREYDVSKREKKVALMERLVKEKMRRADVYLKNAQCSKSKIVQKSTYEKFDTSFSADCGDTSVMPTTAKMYSPIKKGLLRSMSEKKIKFKGHSPLKEINYNYQKKVASTSDIKTKSRDKSFRFSKIFTRDKNDENEPPMRLISWNEETKRQAFKLLKTINHDKTDNIKHTFM